MSAASDIKLFCETILHFDEVGLKKFNYSRGDLYKMWTSSFVQAIRANVKSSFSENHAKKIGDAIISALKKVEIETKNLSDEKKVEVTLKGLSVGNIFSEKDWQLDIKPDSSNEDIVNALVTAVEKKFDELQPVNTTVFVIDCVFSEEEKFWTPLNMDNFMPQLFAGALGNR